MHKVQRSVLVSHSRAQMFDLVADVASYPDFMPWCGGAIVHKHDEHGMEASITISIAGIKQTFTTRNEHDYPNLIKFHLVDGPISELTGKWERSEEHTPAIQSLMTISYAVYTLQKQTN